MSKTVLIHTLGNRDLQFSMDGSIPPIIYKNLLEENTEDEAYLVIKKGSPKGDNYFRKNCKMLSQEIAADTENNIIPGIKFPMVDSAIRYIQEECHVSQIDKLVLIATCQAKPFAFDTDELGALIETHLSPYFSQKPGIEKIEVFYLEISAVSRQDELGLFNGVHKALQNILAEGYDQVFISHKTGLPKVTFALTFAGFFQGYSYLSASDKEVVVEDMSGYEKLIRELIQ